MYYYRRFINWLSASNEDDKQEAWPTSGVVAVCMVLGFGAAAAQRGENGSFVWFVIEGLVCSFGMFLCLGFIATITSAPKRRATRIVVVIAVSVITVLGLEYVYLTAPKIDEETQAAIDEAYEKGKADAVEEALTEIAPTEEYGQDWYSGEDVEWIERDAFDLGYQTGYTASEDGDDRIEEGASYKFVFKTFPERLTEARKHGYQYVYEYEEDLANEDVDSEKEESAIDGTSAEEWPDHDAVYTAKYVVNENTKVFHLPECDHISRLSEENRTDRETTRDQLVAEGYRPCEDCAP